MFTGNRRWKAKSSMRRGYFQRGIVIGPILFIIAIIGVLAAAIAAGTGGFSGSSSTASAKVMASAIVDSGQQIKTAVDFVLANGCEDTEISFENNFVAGYENPNAPADKHCNVFNIDGGHVGWLTPPKEALDEVQHDSQNPTTPFGSYAFATSCGIGLGTGTGSVFSYNATGFPCAYAANAYIETSDLFMFVFWLRKDVCEEINKLAGISVMPGQGNALSAIGPKFTGSYGAGSGGGMVRVVNPRGAMQGCIDATPMNYGAGYYYFRALVVR
jgi:FlaG/FlaF family flagellin (archaellin)